MPEALQMPSIISSSLTMSSHNPLVFSSLTSGLRSSPLRSNLSPRVFPDRGCHPGWGGTKKGILKTPAFSTSSDLQDWARKRTKEQTVLERWKKPSEIMCNPSVLQTEAQSGWITCLRALRQRLAELDPRFQFSDPNPAFCHDIYVVSSEIKTSPTNALGLLGA